MTRDGNGYTPAHLLARAEPSPSTLGLIKRLGAVDAAAFLVGTRVYPHQQGQGHTVEGERDGAGPGPGPGQVGVVCRGPCCASFSPRLTSLTLTPLPPSCCVCPAII